MMDDWTKEQVEVSRPYVSFLLILMNSPYNSPDKTMRTIGNLNSNEIYNPNEIRLRNFPPNLKDTERYSETEQYIRGEQ